jgi:hypothetical protein
VMHGRMRVVAERQVAEDQRWIRGHRGFPDGGCRTSPWYVMLLHMSTAPARRQG